MPPPCSPHPLFPQPILLKAGLTLLDPETLLLLYHAAKNKKKTTQEAAAAAHGSPQLQGESGGGVEGLNREAGDWGGGGAEERLFGKSANPITGSGAALLSLAALKSHFNWLSLSAPFRRYFLSFSPLSTRPGRRSARFRSQFARFAGLPRRGRAAYASHQHDALSPFSCVVSKCTRSLQHRSTAAPQPNWSLSGVCRAAAAAAAAAPIRSAVPSVLPHTPAGTDG